MDISLFIFQIDQFDTIEEEYFSGLSSIDNQEVK